MSTRDAAFALPTGTVTFLLTDVAGSTRMWETEPDDVMRSAIVRHYEILAEVVDAHGGVRPQEQGEGDSIVAAFARPSDALAAASAAQQALAAELWTTSEPVRVRMAVHTGEAQLRDDTNYAGQAIIRTARLRAVGHGGQVLVSGATRDLAVDQTGERFELRSLGEHRLRDLGRPEHVWQLVIPELDDEFEPLATIDAVPNSLPVSLSPFIGRDAEVAELARLVCDERLVTATGTGGAGKSRLAQQVGAELIEGFPAGVWWVELAPLDVDGVEPAVRAAFGISEGATLPLAESVARLLGDRRCLLIVDNCEHVTDRVAPLIHDLLTAAPTLHVLATSRVMLDLPGEQAWRVPALGLPEPGATVPLDALSQYDAVRLFCDRARRARPNFELTTANGATVAEICHRLGGVPLAIELAAARTRMLDPQRILDGLDDAFRILTGGSKALMARQQTLDASIAWSYDLLTPTEQTLLRRLSVFVDGWTLDTAEAICPDPGSGTDSTLDRYHVFDALDRLVDHSLVHTIDTPAGVRFGMLETVRQFSARLLESDSTDSDDVRHRHASHFTGWLTSTGDTLYFVDRTIQDAITAERANVVSATQRMIDEGDATVACHSLFGIAMLLAQDAWIPLSDQLFGQASRILDAVPAADRWRVQWVRCRVISLRSDPPSELDAIDLVRACAEEASQPLGVAIARCQSLTMLSITGAPVFDEMREVVEELYGLDELWAALYQDVAALMAAYTGNLNHYEVFRNGGANLGERLGHDAFRQLADGVAAFFRGDAIAAIAAVSAALASGLLDTGTRNLAVGMLQFAGADLDQPPDHASEADLRRRADADGNVIAGIAADNLALHRALLDDDLDAAYELHRSVVEGWYSIGGIGSAFHPGHPFAAAGYESRTTELDTGTAVAPVVAAEVQRTLAEHLHRSGDVPGALGCAHEGLQIELTEGMHRGVVNTLECVARILVAADRHDEAVRILGACAAFRQDRSLVAFPCLRHLTDDALARGRSALGDDGFHQPSARGEPCRWRQRPSMRGGCEWPTRRQPSGGTRSPPPKPVWLSSSPRG